MNKVRIRTRIRNSEFKDPDPGGQLFTDPELQHRRYPKVTLQNRVTVRSNNNSRDVQHDLTRIHATNMEELYGMIRQGFSQRKGESYGRN